MRSIAPPIRIPMLVESPSLICWEKAGEPDISTVTPGGGVDESTADCTFASTDFWTFSVSPCVSLIWMSVRTLDG